MVKIKAKLMIIGILMITLLVGIAHASRQALEFSDVDVKVGSKTDKNLLNGDTINEEAKPGDAVEFRIQMKNNYTGAENLKIQNIVVKGTIESIDDGDDLEEESSEFDLSTGSDKRVTLKFQVPVEVDEDTFDVLIEAEGDDKNGTNQDASMKIRLEVNKESHKIRITKNTLTPAEVACGRKNVQVGVGLQNIGTDDEKDVNMHILNTDLGIDIKENIGELEAEPFEDTSKFSKTYSFNIPADTEAGIYPIIIRALYDDDKRKAEETATLTVSDCPITKAQQTDEAPEKDKKEEQDLSSAAAQEDRTASSIVQQVPPGTTASTEGSFSGNGFIISVIIAEIIAVVVGIILIVSLVARRG